MQNNVQKASGIYQKLLLLYPKYFRDIYGEEMLQVFQDMYKEQNNIFFWPNLILDTLTNAGKQHSILIQKHGLKKYGQETFHITPHNTIGALLLLPFFLMFALDATARIMQGNLSHPNPIIYEKLFRTIFFNPPAIVLWAIIFPLSATVINLFSLIPKIQKYRGNVISLNFIKTTTPTIAIIGTGLCFFTIIIGHDFIPCMVNNLFAQGIGQFTHTIQFCTRA
jgi:hypothetical protein